MERKTLRISIVGADRSGKTALTVRFLTGKFIYDYLTGHNVMYQHNYVMDSTAVPLDIVDTSGDEDISDEYKESNGIIIVYAIDCAQGFQRAKEILSSMEDTIKEKDMPFIGLVANKTDLWKYKTVEREEGKSLAEQYKCEYFELSALSCKDGVNDMFNSVIQITLSKSKPRAFSLPSNTAISCDKSDTESTVMIPQLQFKDRKRSTSLINILPIEEEQKMSSKTSTKNCSSISLMASMERSISLSKFSEYANAPGEERGSSTFCDQPIKGKKISLNKDTYTIACPQQLNQTRNASSVRTLSSSTSVCDLGEHNKQNLPKPIRRNFTEMSLDKKLAERDSKSSIIQNIPNVIEKKKSFDNLTSKILDNKPGILHTTLGEVGFLAFSTLQVPVAPKKSKSPFTKRRMNGFMSQKPLLVGKQK